MSDDKLPVPADKDKPILHQQDGQIFADSRHIAAHFEKRHDHVLRDIDVAISRSPDLGSGLFIEKSSEDPTIPGRTLRYFELTRDGFSLIAMGFTGEKAFKWKLDYIKAFNAMEAALRKLPEKSPYDWMRAVVDDMEVQDKRLFSVEKTVDKLDKAVENFGAHETYRSIKAHAALEGIKITTDDSKLLGARSKNLSNQKGYTVHSQPDQTFGKVNTYHRDILGIVFRNWKDGK